MTRQLICPTEARAHLVTGVHDGAGADPENPHASGRTARAATLPDSKRFRAAGRNAPLEGVSQAFLDPLFRDQEDRALNSRAAHQLGVGCGRAIGRYRNTVGLDVAIEALRDAWRQKKATADDIIAAAKTDRVATVMRPYLESLV